MKDSLKWAQVNGYGWEEDWDGRKSKDQKFPNVGATWSCDPTQQWSAETPFLQVWSWILYCSWSVGWDLINYLKVAQLAETYLPLLCCDSPGEHFPFGIWRGGGQVGWVEIWERTNVLHFFFRWQSKITVFFNQTWEGILSLSWQELPIITSSEHCRRCQVRVYILRIVTAGSKIPRDSIGHHWCLQRF